jgi:hypothetical protein
MYDTAGTFIPVVKEERNQFAAFSTGRRMEADFS